METSFKGVYGNETIGRTHIRLLHLYRVAEQDKPQGCLESVPLSNLGQDTTQYDALSYAWGHPNMTRTIRIGEYKVPITENLHAALLQLATDTPRMLWVDQICINQADMGERAAQVSIMAEIYRNARHVIIWLGTTTALSRMAFEWMASLSDSHSNTLQSQAPSTVYEVIAGLAPSQITVEDRNLLAAFLQSPQQEAGQALTHILERAWFCRLWVVQEVVANPLLDPIILCGSDCIGFEALQAIARALYKLQLSNRFIFSEEASTNLFNLTQLGDLRKSRKDWVSAPSTRQRSLPNTIAATTLRKCSEPLDRVYAVYSILDEDSFPYRPDYSKTLQELFTDIAIYTLESNNSHGSDGLSLLGVTNLLPDRIAGLPSWAPDWSQYLFHGWHDPNIITTSLPPTTYNASSKIQADPSTPTYWLDHDSKALVMNGIIIDRLDKILRMRPRDDLYGVTLLDTAGNHLEEISDNTLRVVQFLTREFSSLSPQRCQWSNIWQALVADRSLLDFGSRASAYECNLVEALLIMTVSLYYKDQLSTSAPPHSQHRSNLKKRLRQARESVYKLTRGSKRHMLLFPHRLHHSFTSIEAQIGLLLMANTSFLPLFREKDFCITEKGRLAWVPYVSDTETNDVVAILIGYNVPVILRLTDQNARFLFVGECYVQGVMDGEVTVGEGEGEGEDLTVREIWIV